MSSTYIPLTPAQLTWDAQGRVYSEHYRDVYNNPIDAYGQAVEVFLHGNDLPRRWRGRSSFTVCETGMGLGTNFLTLWQAWRDDPARCRRLHMVSIEGHPFTRETYRCLGARHLPETLRGLAEQLAAQWPMLLPGLHRLEFEQGAVTLTLAFGSFEQMASRLSARVDAFFLDGFAPRNNPAMWEPAALRRLTHLAAPDATLATWTSAGFVRRALQEAGFEIERIRGFGGKRHMTIGRRSAWAAARAPVLSTPVVGSVTVIGAGLAGAGVAHALARRGLTVQVVAPAEPMHASHLAAALTPLVARDDNVRARLSRAGSQCALRRWAGLPAGIVRRLGTLHLERDAGRAQALVETLRILAFPAQWVRWVDAFEATQLAGLPVKRGGVFFADGLLLRPQPLIDALLAEPGIQRIDGLAARLTPRAVGWSIENSAGEALAQSGQIVVANAQHARSLLAESDLLASLPRLAQMHALAGEITQIPASLLGGGPRCVVAGEGYLLPAVEGWCVAGGTYVRDASVIDVSKQGQATNLNKVNQLLAATLDCADWGMLPGWAGWRAVLPGRLPMVGELPQAKGVWLATGYASRGLTWSALMGDVIGAALDGEPAILETDLLDLIAPR